MIESFAGETMGTSWSLQAVSPPAGAAVAVQARFDRVVAQMSQWDPASDLSRFNSASADIWHPIPSEFSKVIAAALDLARISDGAFDPCLGRLTEKWGFGGAGSVDAAPTAATEPANHSIDYDAPGRRIRRTEGAALDLSGIAKGYGVDLAAEWLLGEGVRHFLIEVGGELRGEGIRPDGQPWWVDVEVPPSFPGPSPLAPYRVALHDLSIATSGNYRRGFEVDGVRYSHSFDPRTGRPVVHNVSSVTVLHRSCMMADGWATALTVPGPQAAITLADEQGLAVCVVAGQREYLSRGWRAMLA